MPIAPSDAIALAEQAKYRRVWTESMLYRRVSPGLREAPRAARWFDWWGRSTLIDWGCGDGRALSWFQRAGFEARGVDIAPPTDRPDVVTACLWDLPPMEAADFAFCCDVLEHVPEDRITDVLAGIRAHTLTAAWFQIALFPDKVGPPLGLTLHLTVREVDWWLERFDEHFRVDGLHLTGGDAPRLTVRCQSGPCRGLPA